MDVIVPGDRTGEYQWTGYIKQEEMPRTIEPAEDFIVSANNRATPSNYPLNITQVRMVPHEDNGIYTYMDGMPPEQFSFYGYVCQASYFPETTS